jgi:hypothetical protein
MISVVYNEEEAPARRYKAVVDMRGTAGAKHAPLGTGAGEPHSIGYGYSPVGAINEAYRALGEFIYSVKLREEPPVEASPAP